ncbi:MAG: S-layer homology domain-containing protein [Candidatus Gracilibacteria bacterium]|jgi:hypothetical protein
MTFRALLSTAACLNLFWVLPAFAVSFESDIESGLIKRNAIQSEHFQFEFSDIIGNQADSDGDGVSDIIELIAESAEYSWDILVEEMNYEEPIETGEPIIVILDDNYEYLSSGALGITSVLTNDQPYIAIDPWMSPDYLVVTMGHEFYHAIQFGYDFNFAYTYQGINFAEATASWAEDVLFDTVNDYGLYIPDFLSYVDYSIFASIVPTGSLYEYGMNIWPRFLSEYYDNGIVKDIWETYFDSNISYDSDLKLYEAVSAVLDDEGDDLPTVFQEFTLWNLSLEEYEEGSLYPSVLILEGEESQEYTLSDENYAPALYGTNYLYFENSTGQNEFMFHIIKPEGVSFAVSLVPYDGESYDLSKARTQIIEGDEAMEAFLSLENIGAQDGVVAVISSLEIEFESGNNWEVFDQGYLYYYLGNYGLSEDAFQALMDGAQEEVETDQGEKEGEDIEDASDARSEGALTLSILSFDDNSATFSWNRVADEDIDSYELNYGTNSGSYSKSVDIENEYTTFATVTHLDEGETYYFSLSALDEDNDEIGDPSSELVVTPMEWIFEDVSYMDIHFDAIEALVEIGIFEGYSDGSFGPENEINRAELLKILVEGRGIEVDPSTNKNCFPDVREDWYAKYVCYAKNQGWIQGYSDGSFKPADPVNKVEALKMLFEVYEVELSQDAVVANLKYPDLDENAWYAVYVWKASALGVLEELTTANFNPDADRTRGEMAEELYRYLVVDGALRE